MRGRSGCPTGQEKNSVGATGGSPLFYFYKERLGTGSPLPVCETTLPSPPSRWAGRYGRRMQGRRPVSKHRKNLPLITDQREVGPGRREPLSALVFFPPAFFQRKPGPRPGPGGEPRGRFQPAGVFTGPLTDSPLVGLQQGPLPSDGEHRRPAPSVKPRLCRRPWRHPPCGGFFAGK